LERVAAVGGQLGVSHGAGSLEVLAGDIRRPMLGLSSERYARMLADLDAVWHCAGMVTLRGNPVVLRRVNVTGTVHALEVADRRKLPFVHVSTAFVAGARDGLLREDELLTGHGFVNTYEASKHEAERVVHDWVRRTGGRGTIYRPSVLVTDGPNLPPAAPHPIQQLGTQVTELVATFDPRLWPVSLRVPGTSVGDLNLVQVEAAADLMVEDGLRWFAEPCDRAGDGRPSVRTRHIVHPIQTPFATVVAGFHEVLPLRCLLVPAQPTDPTPIERMATEQLASFLPYVRRSKRFEPGALVDGRPPLPAIDADYVIRSLRAAGVSPGSVVQSRADSTGRR